MAKATPKIETVTKSKVIEYEETSVTGITLELTPEEASVIFLLVGRVCGSSLELGRRETDAVYDALYRAKVQAAKLKIIPSGTNSIQLTKE